MALRKISGPITSLDGTEHLDNIAQHGVYHQAQNVRATAAQGYPTGLAGLLEVHNPSSAGMIYQRYTCYHGRGMYYRGYYAYKKTWSPWRRILTEQTP